MNAPRCPACPGSGLLLGNFGSLRWFRCRDCGIDFHRRRRPKKRRGPSATSTRERNHG